MNLFYFKDGKFDFLMIFLIKSIVEFNWSVVKIVSCKTQLFKAEQSC